jgi:hypothetical protein
MNNLFKGLLFLEGHVVDPHLFDDFAPQYGNQRASQRQFRSEFAEAEFGNARHVAPGPATACNG